MLEVGGISAVPSPRLVFNPSFVLFASELYAKFPTPSQVLISAKSTLSISGNCVVKSINLDGSLHLEYKKELKTASDSSDGSNKQNYRVLEIDFESSSTKIVNHGHKLITIEELSKVNHIGKDNDQCGDQSGQKCKKFRPGHENGMHDEYEYEFEFGSKRVFSIGEVDRIRGYVIERVDDKSVVLDPDIYSELRSASDVLQTSFLFDGIDIKCKE